jgi:hypothetical protein
MAWTQPSITDTVINIDATGTPSIPAPVSDDSLKTSVVAFGNCYENAGTCSTAGTYAADTDFQINDGTGAVSLPAWVTWNVGTQTITLAPTDVALTGKTYTVTATYTPDYGTASAFTVMTFTVDCVITSFTRPSDPSQITYNIWDDTSFYDGSQQWVQDPACAHTFTDSFTWTGLNTYIVQDSGTLGRINIRTNDVSAKNTYSVSVQNTITVLQNGEFGTTNEQFIPTGVSDKVTVSVDIVNPCETTTVNSLVFTGGDYSAGVLTVTDTQSVSVTFPRPTTTAEDSNAVVSVCGATTYTVHND